MKMKDELQAIYEDEKNVYYCCYCLQPQNGKIGCCQENHFVEFKYLFPNDQKQIAQEILNG
jgi:hypothetical protein